VLISEGAIEVRGVRMPRYTWASFDIEAVQQGSCASRIQYRPN
jgi:hypothetical protein